MLFRYVLLSLLLAPAGLFAQSKAIIPDPDPEIERKSFILPEGFEVNLYAADPLLAKPIQMNFDPQGRLWVACSEVYPHIKPGAKANDKILILEDTKGEGKADKVTVFADGLLIPTGVEPGDGGAYVANSTELLHLSASKPGGKADKTRVVLSGFGTEDTHHVLHTLRWGPDGALYMNQSIYIHSHIETPHGVKRLNGGGIWRFRPETMDLDVFVRGFVNAWGHHFDRFGQSFVTDGAGGEGINHAVPGAGYPTVVGMSRILHGMNPGSPKYCGLEILSGSHLPDEWRGNLITNDFRGHRVCRFVLKDDGSTYASQEKTELIKSDHPAFRPIDVKMGPDGAIYVADWYNPIIQHGEIDFRDPRRDHTHGRIWRITAKGRPLVKKPDLLNMKTPELLDHLKEPEDWTRHNAKRVLKERGAKEVLPALKQWLSKLERGNPESEAQLLEGLWTYQSLDDVNADLLTDLLNAKDARIRAAATRVAAAWQARLTNALELLAARVVDENPRVRMEAVRALAQLKSARAAETALAALDRPLYRVLDYSLWLTTKELEPYWLPAFKEGKLDFKGDANRLNFALQTSGAPDTVKPLLELLKSGRLPADREDGIWLLLTRTGGPAELQAALSKAADPKRADASCVNLIKAVEDAVRSRRLAAPGQIDGVLQQLLHHKNQEVVQAALRLSGLWKLEKLREFLEAQATSATSVANRQAALEGLVALSGNASEALIAKQAGPGSTAEQRIPAIVAMLDIDPQRAAGYAADILGEMKPSDALLELFGPFLNRKGGAAALAKALDGKKLPADVAKIGLRAVRASTQEVPALIEVLNKAGNLAAQKRDFTKPELDALVGDVIKTGNAARGELLYRRNDLQCLNCHAIGGAGGQVGPDLASIGASAPVDFLVESLLIPTKAVKEGFHAVRVETLDGKVYTGVKVRESKTELAIRTAEDKEIVIQVKDIEDKRESRSLMPDGLIDTLTRSELIDMVKFLSELGKVGPYSLSKTHVVRRWQALQPTPEAIEVFRDSRIAAAAGNNPVFVWKSAYTLVSGELPIDEVASFSLRKDAPLFSVIRCQLDVTAPGKVKLKLNSTVGISLFVGNSPVEVADDTIVDLPAGTQTLMFAVELSKRKEPLRVELEDVKDSPARMTIVGGK